MHDLKQELSSFVSEAAAGAEIVITRHNKPVARLSQPGTAHLHQGARFGKASLKPAVRGKKSGRFLQVLQEDRRAGRD